MPGLPPAPRRAHLRVVPRPAARRPGALDSPAPVGSSSGGRAKLDGGARSPTPPATETLPPDLAENPDYEVLGELGRGGMGVVYLARNRLMGRKEVLKVVSGNLLDRSIVRERFLREIRNAAQLHHPNIVTAYSAVRAGDRIVLAMEHVEGCDLASLVKSRGPLPVADAANFAYQAALGLQHAHERGMIHRDIKPSNLMLAGQGKRATVKILDFGLAKATQEAPIDGGLTREGQMLGTPDYIAPEQSLDAQKADIRADIYSLGCTLYCFLTGGPPFEAHSLYEILQAHHSRDAQPLNLARPEVPAELAALVAKMMAKDPRQRFQTPGEVARALKPFFKPGDAVAVAARVTGRPQRGTLTSRRDRPRMPPAPQDGPHSGSRTRQERRADASRPGAGDDRPRTSGHPLGSKVCLGRTRERPPAVGLARGRRVCAAGLPLARLEDRRRRRPAERGPSGRSLGRIASGGRPSRRRTNGHPGPPSSAKTPPSRGTAPCRRARGTAGRCGGPIDPDRPGPRAAALVAGGDKPRPLPGPSPDISREPAVLKVENTGVKPSLDIRRVRVGPGIVRLADRKARRPFDPFWPPLRPTTSRPGGSATPKRSRWTKGAYSCRPEPAATSC